MKRLRDEGGQALVITALCVTVLLGMMAFAVDVGLLFRAKRNAQIAADAAATAAALDYYYNSSSTNAIADAEAIGLQAAEENGFTPSANGPTVTFNTAPDITTPYHNSTGYFEAIVTEPQQTAFMSLFGFNNMTVGARAVAGTPGAAQGCVYVMDTAGNLGKGNGGDSTMYLQGSFDVNAVHCGVVINGTASDTLYFNGGGGQLTAGSVSVVGGASGQTGDSTPAPVTGVAPVTDPLQSVTPPTPTNCIAGGSLSGTSSAPLTVGTSGGTVCYSGDSSGNITVSNVQLNGTVIFSGAGTVTFGGNVSSGSEGSSIDINSGGMTENAGTVFNVSAPTSGTYNGIVLMAPNTNNSVFEFEFGNSKGTLTGTINGLVDIPRGQLFLHDSGGGTSGLILNVDLVVGEINDQTGSLTVNSYSATNTNSPLKEVALVE